MFYNAVFKHVSRFGNNVDFSNIIVLIPYGGMVYKFPSIFLQGIDHSTSTHILNLNITITLQKYINQS